MATSRQIRWLNEQISEWSKEGVLDAETAERIRSRYDASAARSTTTIFAVLGALFIGLGIILLIAHNWENLSRNGRAALSLGLLATAQAVGAFTLWRHRDRSSIPAGAGESSAILIALAVLACIALVSQTYHFPGNLEGYLFTCLCLCVPLPYLFGSRGAASLYLLGTLVWLVAAKEGPALRIDPGITFTGFIAAVLPFLWRCASSRAVSYRDPVLGGIAVITIPIGILVSLEFWDTRWAVPLAASLASAVYALGLGGGAQASRDTAPNGFTPAARLFGGLAIGVLALVESYSEFWTELVRELEGPVFRPADLIGMALGIVCMGFALRAARRSFSAGSVSQPLFLAIAPITLVAQEVMFAANTVSIPILFLNAYALLLGLRTMTEGVGEGDLRRANFGLLLVGALVLARFADLEWSYTVRGLAFISMGVAFLLVNLRIRRQEARV